MCLVLFYGVYGSLGMSSQLRAPSLLGRLPNSGANSSIAKQPVGCAAVLVSIIKKLEPSVRLQFSQEPEHLETWGLWRWKRNRRELVCFSKWDCSGDCKYPGTPGTGTCWSDPNMWHMFYIVKLPSESKSAIGFWFLEPWNRQNRFLCFGPVPQNINGTLTEENVPMALIL